MGIHKDMFIAAHEELIAEAMEADPTLSWDEAYQREDLSDAALRLSTDRFADMCDRAKEERKYVQ